MSARQRPAGARTLKQAAATLFSLLALLPLLIFVWTLYRLDALGDPAAQVGIGLSLGIAVLGFAVLRRLMGQISSVMQALAATAARASRGAPPGIRDVADPGGPTNGVETCSKGSALPSDQALEERYGAFAKRASAATPGLGTIREIADMTAAVSALWRREAETHVGAIVKVDVINSTAPVIGTLLQVTDDGLLLEHDGERLGVVWRRIAAVERDAKPAKT